VKLAANRMKSWKACNIFRRLQDKSLEFLIIYHTDFVCVTDAKNLDYAALQGMNISLGCKLVGFADLDTRLLAGSWSVGLYIYWFATSKYMTWSDEDQGIIRYVLEMMFLTVDGHHSVLFVLNTVHSL
jgi:hypothetical protein